MTVMANENLVDVALVGSGIMSATLGALLRELDPAMTIQCFERLQGPALESTLAMNNAGTGHAANCELNYTPEQPDGSVAIGKALAINGAFEVSLQFWSHLVEQGVLGAPRGFLNPVPHQSWVWGDGNTRFLRARHAQLSGHPMFQGMEYSEDRGQLAEWMPLMMKDRQDGLAMAATRVARGTDLDFGAIARQLFASLESRGGFQLHVQHEVVDRCRQDVGWRLTVKDHARGGAREIRARFVFLGAGGGALPLVLKAGLPEAAGYGGFPVSGQWLVCRNPEIIKQHQAKVYGRPSLGAPPMSVPHLDSRVVDGERSLLFGPYAGFTTKYLKHGSYTDMLKAINLGNLWPMMAAGWHNLDLTRYLIGQVLQSPEDRMVALREFVPSARLEDWHLDVAGQRVQIIKKDPKLGGRLEFGTELLTAADGSLAAMLGASPGASTGASTMIDLLQRCFPDRVQSQAWQTTLRLMVPSYGQDLTREPELLKAVRARTNAVLGLEGA